ncbi:MAG TPA: hypothetical protein VGD79_10670 [Thermoanaerobaculia bacterium]
MRAIRKFAALDRVRRHPLAVVPAMRRFVRRVCGVRQRQLPLWSKDAQGAFPVLPPVALS